VARVSRELTFEEASERYRTDPVFKDQCNAQLAYTGDLSWITRPHAQRDVYNFTNAWKVTHPDEAGPIVWNCHRGMGKSFLGLLMCVERCLKYPNQEVRFGSPTGVQTADIAKPNLRLLLDLFPEQCRDLHPEPSGKNYYFRNPAWGNRSAVSTLHLVSCKDEAQSKRGPRSDLIFLDECRDISDLTYVIDDVLWFHFTGRRNPLMILSSTPPDSCSHPYWTKYQAESETEERYIRRNVEENADFSKVDEKMLLAICKDKKSTTWKREALCLKAPNEKSMLVPEWITDDEVVKKASIFTARERPKYYFPHVVMDLGCMDNTAAVFCYIDFEMQELVVEDEVVVHYKSLGEIAKLVKDKAAEVFPLAPYPIRWIADNDGLELQTLRRDHQIYASAAERWDPEAGIASLRTKFSQGKIRISAKCKRLIEQLDSGLKDDKGKIVRDENPEIGHLDAIMALVYANRMIHWSRNPNPIRVETAGSDRWIRKLPPYHSDIPVTYDPVIITRGGGVVN
jgi:hypothetical protein